MDQVSNEIRSTVLTSIKSPIEVLNLTKSLEVPVTTEKISSLDHVATTNLYSSFNSHLGYGDCKLISAQNNIPTECEQKNTV